MVNEVDGSEQPTAVLFPFENAVGEYAYTPRLRSRFNSFSKGWSSVRSGW